MGASLRGMAGRGESFRLHLSYFTEQQQGQRLTLLLEYGYAGVLPLQHMPDYRLIQLVVEEVLYVYGAEWVDVFWEMQNREVVRRLLVAFPLISWVHCEMTVAPSDMLPITRTSVVKWERDDLPTLPREIATFLGKAEMPDFHRPLPDACWYTAPPPTFNIGAPRYLLSSLQPLHAKLAAVGADADLQRAVADNSPPPEVRTPSRSACHPTRRPPLRHVSHSACSVGRSGVAFAHPTPAHAHAHALPLCSRTASRCAGVPLVLTHLPRCRGGAVRGDAVAV